MKLKLNLKLKRKQLIIILSCCFLVVIAAATAVTLITTSDYNDSGSSVTESYDNDGWTNNY
jgi:hypothetical protein